MHYIKKKAKHWDILNVFSTTNYSKVTQNKN